MNKFLRKTARAIAVFTIPALFLMSCSEDTIEPDNASPEKWKIRTPR